MLELKLEPYIKDMTKPHEVLIDTGVGTRVSEGWFFFVPKMSLQRGLHFLPLKVLPRVYDKIQQHRHCYVIW
jgi:hypothetical protein